MFKKYPVKAESENGKIVVRLTEEVYSKELDQTHAAGRILAIRPKSELGVAGIKRDVPRWFRHRGISVD